METRSIRRAPGRTAAALLIVGTSAGFSLGFGASPSLAADPVLPSGGCWSYVPSGSALDAAPTTDNSTALEPWSDSGDGSVALASSGATAVGSKRSVTVTVTDGPVLSTAVATSGTASVLLSVDGRPLADPVEVPFAVAAGQPVDGLVAGTDLTIADAGPHEVRLDAIYFDDPARSLRVACNGQTGHAATPGTNPATTPKPTDLTSGFTAVSGPTVAIDTVSNQAVKNAGRMGDEVALQLAGFASGSVATITSCSTSDECAPLASAILGPDGGASTTFVIPSSAPATAGTLVVDDGATKASTGFTVLATQGMTAGEKVAEDATTISLVGSGWDPDRDIVIQGHAGDSGSAAKTGDAAVTVRADATGAFSTSYTVADDKTVSVIAEQARTSSSIGSIYLISGVIGAGAAADGTGSGGGSGGGTGGSTTGGTAPGGSSTPSSDIPVPTDIPVAGQVPVQGGLVPTDVVGQLEISDVRLDGQDGVGTLFGGTPRRTLTFVVQNAGKTAVAAPLVQVAVGRSPDVEPLPVAVPIGDLAVGGRVVVSVPVELPTAALGTYHVVAQVGDDPAGAFDVAWTSYPWGLLALDAVGLALLIAGIGSRVVLRRRPDAAVAPAPVVEADPDAIVDLSAAERWWASRGDPSRSKAS